MSKLKIAYNNILDSLDSYTFAVGTEDSDNTFFNTYDNLLFDSMKLAASATPYEIEITLTSSLAADYIAFYKTELSTAGGSIKLQYWTGSAWADASTTISPTDTRPILKTFSSQTSDQWKLIIDNNNTEVNITDIKIGELTTTEHGVYIGFTVPDFGRDVEYIESTSDTGLPLGRSLRRTGVSTTLNLEFITDTWARSTWLPFVKHAERLPFYVAWNITDYADEIMYAVTDGAIGKPKQTHPQLMSTNLKIKGFVE